jgi:hypothetical protein
MAKAKKEVATTDHADGVKDPYSAGEHMENPEPNNNRGNGPVKRVVQSGPIPVMQAHKVKNSHLNEQLAVAKGRKEK